jgi:hypothetical protein
MNKPIDSKEVRKNIKTTLKFNEEARCSKYKPACDVCASILKYFANIPTSEAEKLGIRDLIYVTRGLLVDGLTTGISDPPCEGTHNALEYYLGRRSYRVMEAWNFYLHAGRRFRKGSW